VSNSAPIQVLELADLKVAGRRMSRARASLAKLAQHDPALFAQLVMKHEKTGKGIRLAPMHKAWHDLLGQHDRLVIWSHIEAGKTNQVSIARVLWEVGRDPSLRVLILSNTHGQAAKIISSLASYIEHSAELHAVFPELLPTARNQEPWKPLSGQLTVQRKTVSKDATITAAGVRGNILGARYDLVILDDVLDAENTHTTEQRKGLVDWLQSTVQSRLTQQGRMVVVGTAWHPEDALHHYARAFCSDGVQRAFRYPVIDDDLSSPTLGAPRWPEAWPMERVERQRREFHPAEFARTMLCEARDDSTSRFKREWIDVALMRGAAKTLQRSNMGYGPTAGVKFYTGVDLAVQQHSSADLTVLSTIAVYPNGDRELLEILAGRWAGPDIVGRIMDVHNRFQSVVIVENNASQDFILQFTRSMSSVPVKPFTTGKNKAHPEFGIESLAVEMQNGKWILPCKGGQPPEVIALVNEMLYYDPASHTGDRLMSLWFAREGARMGTIQGGYGRIDLMSRRYDLTDVETYVKSALHEDDCGRRDSVLGASRGWRK
jgi:hypothetical protein